MIVIFTRALILYFVVVIVIRMMGKRQVAQMQPSELVIMIMIAELAATPMENTDIPLLNGVVPIIALLVSQVLISYFSLKSEAFRDLICGKPSILIHKGRMNQSEMHRLRVNTNDLMEAIRSEGYFNINEVYYAILETDGQMSIIPRASERPTNISDLNIKEEEQDLPVTLIANGKLNNDKLRKTGYDEKWLEDQLKTNNIKNIEDVFFGFLSSDKKFYVQEKVRKKKKIT